MKAFAEPGLDARSIEAVGIGPAKAAGALEHVGRPSEALRDEERRRHTALRRVRRLDALAGGAGVVELRDAAGIAAGESNAGENIVLGVAGTEEEPTCGG